MAAFAVGAQLATASFIIQFVNWRARKLNELDQNDR
jgi:hypothetical protein